MHHHVTQLPLPIPRTDFFNAKKKQNPWTSDLVCIVLVVCVYSMIVL